MSLLNTKFSCLFGKLTEWKQLGCTRKYCTRHALHSKSLLGHARQSLAARNHWLGVFRSHLALEIAARASFFVFDSARKHCLNIVFSHILESTTRTCSATTGRSKSLLGRAPKPLSARNRCSSKLLCIRQRPKTIPQRCFFVHLAGNHCSDVLGGHRGLEITARACFEPT